MRWFDIQSRSSKLLNILEQLETVSAADLSKRFSVSTRTIKNEINELNDQLGKSANIEFKSGNYRLYILNIPKYIEIKNSITEPTKNFDIPENRIAYISDVLFNESDFVLIDDLAYDIAVSRTTLIHDLTKLRNILKEYNITISGKPNTGLKAEGKEYSIRRFILENTYDLLYDDNYLDPDLEEELDNLMKDYNFESEIIKVFKKYLILSLDRFLNHFEMSFPGNIGSSLKSNPFRVIIEKLSKILSSKMNIELTEPEEMFLLLPLVGMRIPVNTDSIDNFIEIDEETLELIDKILKMVKEETDIDFVFDDSLEEFMYHIYFLCQRLRYQIFVENPVKEDMKNNYGFAWSIAEHIAKLIEKETGNRVNEDEIGFLTAYYALFIENQQKARQKQFKVLVIHQKGGATMRLITYKLKKVFSSDVIIDAVANQDNLIGNINDYDLIITTDKLNLETNKPVLLINEIIDEKKLKNQIDQITYTQDLNTSVSTKAQTILLNLLDDSKIFKISKEKTYLSVLKNLSEEAERLRLTDKDFLDRLLLREEKATMQFSESLAFPHTLHYQGKDPFVLLALAPEGLLDFPKLKVIILAGLPEESREDMTLVHLYEEIVKLASHPELIEPISQSENYQELLNLLIIEHPIFE